MLSRLASSALELPPLLYVVVALGTVWYIKIRRSTPSNIPPFPVKPWPFIGHIPMLKDGPVKAFKEWKKSTGDIFSFYVGSQLTVVISSYPILKEAFVKNAEHFSDRTETYLTKHFPHGDKGIVGSSGPNWKEQRTASLSILRSFGMGKNYLAEKINEEIACYIQALTDFNGEATNIGILTNICVSNVICAILVGNRFEYDDPYFQRLVALINENVSILGHLQLLNTFPWLRFLPGDRFGARRLLQNGNEIRSHFCGKFIKATKEEEGGIDNFINAYYGEMDKKAKSATPTYLDEDNLFMVVQNLFMAGTETTSTSILWSMVYAIHYPKAQEKLYQEILDVLGTDRTPSIQDKGKMNYTNAFILEVIRMATIAPLSLPHLCSEDVEIAGYNIPKGTVILANFDAILHESKTWGDPEVFRPERFIDENNSLTQPEEFIPFSIGRRYCVGESLAKMELFLFVTSIFQRFRIEPEDPKILPSLEPKLGAANSPAPFKAKIIVRN